MASTMLVSRNETSNFLSPNHHQPPRTTTNNFMGKIPFLNPNPNPNPNSNFTPNNNNHNQNHNNHFSRKQLNHQNGDGFLSPSANEDAGAFNHRKSNDASLSHYVSYDLTRFSKSEIRNLKARLMSELDKVRSLSNRIETGELRNVSNHTNNHNNSSKKRPFPVQQQVKEPKRGKQQPQLQPPPQSAYVASPQLMKMCAPVLSKLMKQKAGYIFNEPVDVVGMGLHDYHTIVKRPMDLGTIKKNLGEKGFYRTPDEFAADVRLTFNNALMYNPKGHEVHNLAEKFLEKFEQYYRPVYHKFQFEKQQFLRQQKAEARPLPKEDVVVVVDEVQGNSWSKIPSPEPPRVESPPRKPEPRPEPRVVELPPRVEPPPPPPPRPEPRVEPPPRAEPPPPPPRPEPVSAPTPAPEPAHMSLQEAVRAGSVGTGRGSGGKLPKPKAKDPNKREMNMEEKHKLGAGLQTLPEEKMNQVIHIIRKRNGHLPQDGDEIELDIEAVDTETLWELDRLVTNYKKMVSKMRRQALMDLQNNNVGHHHHGDHDQVGVSERVMETAKAVKRGGGDVGDEDVDIGGDEMPVQNFPPVEIDKDDDKNHDGGGRDSSSSSSSSSGSDSSSSSDSDSGSSSGSDSDVDDAQSRDNESKNVPQ